MSKPPIYVGECHKYPKYDEPPPLYGQKCDFWPFFRKILIFGSRGRPKMTIFQNRGKNHFFGHKVVGDHHIYPKYDDPPPLYGQKSDFYPFSGKYPFLGGSQTSVYFSKNQGISNFEMSKKKFLAP